MGNCCSWKQSESNEETMIGVNSIANSRMHREQTIALYKQSQSKENLDKYYSFVLIQNKINNKLNELLRENMKLKSISKTNIRIITIEIIWNLIKFYGNDYMNAPYLLYDLRDKEEKTENFLKNFRCINYSIKDIQYLDNNKKQKFKKFIKDKNIIIIPKDYDNIKIILDIVSILRQICNTDKTFYILGDIVNLDHNNIPTSIVKYSLYLKLDDQSFEYYPYLFFPLKSIKYLYNNNFIYLNNNKTKSNTINDYINNKDIIDFLNTFNISVIIDIETNEINENTVNTISINDNKKFNITKTDDSNNNNNLIEDIVYLKYSAECINNIDKLEQLIFISKLTILNQKTTLIYYNKNEISESLLSKWISTLLCKNFYFYKYFYNENKDEEFEMDENIVNDESDIIINSIKSLEPMLLNDVLITENLADEIKNYYKDREEVLESDRSGLKSEIYNHIKSMWDTNEDKFLFFEIISIIEKLILNILVNPKMDKFYKIRKNSKTMQNIIFGNSEAKYLFIIIGFKTDINEDYYILDLDTNINEIKNLYYHINESVEMIIKED